MKRALDRQGFGGLALTTALGSRAPAPRASRAGHRKPWLTTWAASPQGPYPSGGALALPDQRFAFPSPGIGAEDQSFRTIVRPSLWGRRARLRFTNVFGTRPLRLDGVFVGLQQSSATIVAGSSAAVRFAGRRAATLPPGADLWSDPVTLPFVADAGLAALAGRKLAISYHVIGQSGPMTWHAKALQTSYMSRPGAGSRGGDDGEDAFPYSTTAWFFLDAVDMQASADTPLIVCLGDSLTDGTGSTLNGDDRWPDILQRRLHRLRPNGVAVVNAGIGGNQIIGPAVYDVADPAYGGPSALQRLERDVASLSGVSTVFWWQGINDLSRANDAPAASVIDGYTVGVAALRARMPDVRVVGATIAGVRGATGHHGTDHQDRKRHAINAFLRTGDTFDAIVDVDRILSDPDTGEMKTEFVPSSTIGGPGDNVHPNRAGYLAIAQAIDIPTLLPGF